MSARRKDKILPIGVRAYNSGVHYDYGSMPVKKSKANPQPPCITSNNIDSESNLPPFSPEVMKSLVGVGYYISALFKSHCVKLLCVGMHNQ
jgi:hypothetical protein